MSLAGYADTSLVLTARRYNLEPCHLLGNSLQAKLCKLIYFSENPKTNWF